MELKEKKRQQLKLAFDFLTVTLAEPKTPITVAATVQAFEMALELSWKWLKFVLNDYGILVSTPREIIRHAGKEKLIDDVEKWLLYLDARNLTSHTYNQDTGDTVYLLASEFKGQFQELYKL